MSDATYEMSLERTIDSLEYELEAKDKEIERLKAAIESALYGELLDDVGNRDDNGLNAHPDTARIKQVLKDALQE